MNKLNSIALCTLITPVLIFSAGSALAQQPAAQDNELEPQTTQQEYGNKQNDAYGDKQDAYGNKQDAYGNKHENKSNSGKALGHVNKDDQSNNNQAHQQNRGFLDANPANGVQASTLIGAEVTTTNDEEVGSVSDLIINSQGQVVAIVVGVGGYLGMGEKSVAIGWDDVTRTGNADNQELRIMMTRDQLSSAPEFDTGLETELETEIETEFGTETDTETDTNY